MLETLDIVVDDETPSRTIDRVLDLARAERLTAYDAAYLEPAMRLGIPLASKGADLCDAAERLGARVLLNGQSLKAPRGGNIAPQSARRAL